MEVPGRSEREVGREQLEEFVGRIFGEEIHAKRMASLINGVDGVLHAATLGIRAIGQGLAAAQGLAPDRTALPPQFGFSCAPRPMRRLLRLQVRVPHLLPAPPQLRRPHLRPPSAAPLPLPTRPPPQQQPADAGSARRTGKGVASRLARSAPKPGSSRSASRYRASAPISPRRAPPQDVPAPAPRCSRCEADVGASPATART